MRRKTRQRKDKANVLITDDQKNKRYIKRAIKQVALLIFQRFS